MIVVQYRKNMLFRRLKLEEAEILPYMLYEAIFVPEGVEPYPFEVIYNPGLYGYIDSWGVNPTDLAIVCEIEGIIVGAVWGRIMFGYGYIDDFTPEISLAVYEGYRNLGIGTRLLLEIEEAYRALDLKALSLSVDRLNRAYWLYERNGFQYYTETETAFIMKKDLV